jgi:hypothetical protein
MSFLVIASQDSTPLDVTERSVTEQYVLVWYGTGHEEYSHPSAVISLHPLEGSELETET